ncbi:MULTISPECIES: bifunctional nicotinamide-nucleotide adenylyltransferase/Nudix hydroxylase [Francisella]|uniref:NUDIX domain-containing protein n=1 Tax=Francisella opportunistica TaxID=2016517 RepID=A0A345JSH9_9GAMM|nr:MULTISPECIES: bifunctional nicotinamide-nucleotide adenylyltransferase/Nudix hydroxylase [Francisella]APC92045.1 Nicotinamide-nucleotide adenylyltransferase, NadM family / ADP-ribose pyrophosphatase [Francisella sp. MA067296]AXH30275.1 NUDIX domain-containing protein [Francisella opportunistica]AXH31916.1 ADP-ribose pyrophosphatase [Francisella opportunistica]AXH33562.1 ADP-ribose pyrophosphatase [Francisella opportunistica]
MYDISVFVGRFQPFHKGHLHNISVALQKSKKIIINVGSSFNAPNIKNPFSFEQRKQMIKSDLQIAGIDLDIVAIEPLADFFYQEQKWQDVLRKNVYKHAKNNESIAIAGYIKDSSSYYIKSFPEWDYIPVDNYKDYNATEFRKKLYKGIILKQYMCSDDPKLGTYNLLIQFMHSEVYQDLVAENNYVIEYKRSWQNAPFNPNFVTVDALVIVNDHILMVQRKGFPGKGLWALPGGFLECDETISQAIIGKLIEETNISLSEEQLAVAKRCEKVFDYPERSVRGRTISHVGLFVFDEWPSLPEVNAADTKWMALDSTIENMCDKMLEDHYQIITILLEECGKKL